MFVFSYFQLYLITLSYTCYFPRIPNVLENGLEILFKEFKELFNAYHPRIFRKTLLNSTIQIDYEIQGIGH